MKVYFGNPSDEFKIEAHIESRYGFRAMFFSTNVEVARLFAKYHANEKRKPEGFVYECDVPTPGKRIDFNLGISYSIAFRNLIHKLHRENIKSALIERAIDYPSDEFRSFTDSDIVVQFDLGLITDIKLIETVRI